MIFLFYDKNTGKALYKTESSIAIDENGNEYEKIPTNHSDWIGSIELKREQIPNNDKYITEVDVSRLSVVGDSVKYTPKLDANGQEI